MVSLEPLQGTIDAASSPRISFSADQFSDDSNFICITPKSHYGGDTENQNERSAMNNNNNNNAEFEFLSGTSSTLLSADELFFEGKLLPFWQMQHSEKLQKISLKAKEEEDEDDDDDEDEDEEVKKKMKKEEETRVNWFLDEDPSPRPPKLARFKFFLEPCSAHVKPGTWARIRGFGSKSRAMLELKLLFFLSPSDTTWKISPALIRGPKDELAAGAKVTVVEPERGHWLAKTTTPSAVTFKSCIEQCSIWHLEVMLEAISRPRIPIDRIPDVSQILLMVEDSKIQKQKHCCCLLWWSYSMQKAPTYGQTDHQDIWLLQVPSDLCHVHSLVHINVQRGAVPPLIEMLHSSDIHLREMSAFALGRLALSFPSFSSLFHLYKLLGKDIHNQAGIAHNGGLVPLLKLLDSKNASLQHNAAFALYGLADNEVCYRILLKLR
ncbi:mental retardation GTPase activating protein-like protein 4 [Senna tora]|uniref:Mental retardation GTPase activating protein-like protein 4 n=1 Tax=Senna tora TaxID=362788 RepID=A0A834W2H1_9FABA|nr:mental retardation GTPase activating protein-like protein 4 [Senna tora]